MTEKLNIIRTFEALVDFHNKLKSEEVQYVAFDTETTGVDKSSNVIGYSICCDTEEAYYVILREWNPKTQTLVWVGGDSYGIEAECVLETLLKKSLIMHNGPFDIFMVRNNFGIDLMPAFFHDTMISGHLLNENLPVGLKERGIMLYGEDAAQEQREMKESVTKNGGMLTKTQYELYKADADLIAKYGAKDAILTLKLFYNDVPLLFEQGLDKFFYEDESMPLLKTATYELNYTGLKIDQEALNKLKAELQAEIAEASAFIYQEIDAHVKDKYPGTSKAKTFNINASQQLAWLLFIKLNNMFGSLTKGGREMCKELGIKVPYSNAAKRDFVKLVTEYKGKVYQEAKYNYKTKKMGKPKKVGDPWKYLSTGKDTLGVFAQQYKWVKKLLEYKKAEKLLGTYVEGIQSKLKYGIIYPSFLQHGTTSGRYSCKTPNFQNLPRDDKRIKRCVIARPGNVLVGADQSQLEPRCFASTSQDPTLMACFEKGEDFYSVVGAPIFDKTDCSMFKEDKSGFAEMYPDLRDTAKKFALASPYGTTGFQQSLKLGKPAEECDQIIRKYFDMYPLVEKMMLDSHEQVKNNGVVYNLFGRPRRMPEGRNIRAVYGNAPHSELPYKIRNLLNLGMNHRVQSTAASIMNRIAIAVRREIDSRAMYDDRWKNVHIILQVHDSLILEGPKELEKEMSVLLQDKMENTVTLPGVKLQAEPKIGLNLAEV